MLKLLTSAGGIWFIVPLSCSAVSEAKGNKGKKQKKGGNTPANLGSSATLQEVRQVRIDKVSYGEYKWAL